MPDVQSVSFDGGVVVIVQRDAATTIDLNTIPASSKTTPAKAEAFINNWLAQNIDDMQVVCHVFSVVPPSVSILTTGPGDPIPANWWV